MKDAYRRGMEYFHGRDFDAIEANDFYGKDMRRTADHLYQTKTQTPPLPQRDTPEKIDWGKLPPAERLTRFREQQAQEAQQRR
jgi:hypothetical protein